MNYPKFKPGDLVYYQTPDKFFITTIKICVWGPENKWFNNEWSYLVDFHNVISNLIFMRPANLI
mgnify:CR=1 FL=1